MRIAFCRHLLFASTILTANAKTAPLQTVWVDTGQVLTCPDSTMTDNFPSAISTIPGQFIVSDVWTDASKMSVQHRKRLKQSGKLSSEFNIDEVDQADRMGTLYRFTLDSSGHFQGDIETFQIWHLFGFSLGLTELSELASTPDQNRVYRYKACDHGDYISDHWFSEPKLLHLEPFFGSAIAVSSEWLAIAAEDQEVLNDGEVFIYPREGKEWGNTSQSLKPDDTGKHFGHQLQMKGSQLLITTQPYKGGSTALGAPIWKQDIYAYNLVGNEWKKSGNTLQLPIPPTGLRASVTLLDDRIVATGYDYTNALNTLTLFGLSNNKWMQIDREDAPKGSIDFGYTLQTADSQLLVSLHHPQSVKIFNADSSGIHDSNQVINNSDPDKRPGFADLMAFDGKYLFIVTKGTTANANAQNNFKGKIFVFTRKSPSLMPEFTHTRNSSLHH